MMETAKKIGGTVSGEAGGGEAERVLREEKNVVENGHGCCGIYSTRFAVALVFGRGGTHCRGCWIKKQGR